MHVVPILYTNDEPTGRAAEGMMIRAYPPGALSNRDRGPRTCGDPATLSAYLPKRRRLGAHRDGTSHHSHHDGKPAGYPPPRGPASGQQVLRTRNNAFPVDKLRQLSPLPLDQSCNILAHSIMCSDRETAVHYEDALASLINLRLPYKIYFKVSPLNRSSLNPRVRASVVDGMLDRRLPPQVRGWLASKIKLTCSKNPHLRSLCAPVKACKLTPESVQQPQKMPCECLLLKGLQLELQGHMYTNAGHCILIPEAAPFDVPSPLFRDQDCRAENDRSLTMLRKAGHAITGSWDTAKLPEMKNAGQAPLLLPPAVKKVVALPIDKDERRTALACPAAYGMSLIKLFFPEETLKELEYQRLRRRAMAQRDSKAIAKWTVVMNHKRAKVQYYLDLDATPQDLVAEATSVYSAVACWREEWCQKRPQPPSARVQPKGKSFKSQLSDPEQCEIKGRPIISYFKNFGGKFSKVLGRCILFLMTTVWNDSHYIDSIQSFRAWVKDAWMLENPVADVADVSAMFTAINRDTAFSAIKCLVSDIKTHLGIDASDDGYILMDEDELRVRRIQRQRPRDASKSVYICLSDLLDLLTAEFSNTAFLVLEMVVRQLKGIPMGAPSSPAIALVVCIFIRRGCRCAVPSTIYISQYMDDLIMVRSRGAVDYLRIHLIPELNKCGMDLEYTDEDVVELGYLQFLVNLEKRTVQYAPREKLCWVEYDKRYPKNHFIRLAIGMLCMIYDCSSASQQLLLGMEYTFRVWHERNWPASVVRAATWEMLCKRMPGMDNQHWLSRIMAVWREIGKRS